MALNLNTWYYREWIDRETLDTMRISLLPGYVDYLPGSLTPVELPPDFIIENTELTGGYDKQLPVGRALANEMTIQVDLNGLTDRGSTAWSDLEELIITGISTAKTGTGTIPSPFSYAINLPNIWKYENITQSKILFVGTQEETPGVTYSKNNTESNKIKVLGIEAYIYGFITNDLLKEEILTYTGSLFYTTPVIIQNEYSAGSNRVQAKYSMYDKAEKSGEGGQILIAPFYLTVAQHTEYLMKYLADTVITTIMRDIAATVGYTNNYLVSHNLYKKTALSTGLRGAALNTGTDIYQIYRMAKPLQYDNFGGLYYDEQTGWVGNPNVWDLLSELCEQGICKLTADYNSTDELTMNFTKLFDSSSGTITFIEEDGAAFERGFGYADSYSVTRTGTYEDDIDEILSTGTKTSSGDSYDMQAIFETIGNVAKFVWSNSKYHLQLQSVPNIRALYYKYTSMSNENAMQTVHPRITIDLGDSITETNTASKFTNLPSVKEKLLSKYNWSYMFLAAYATYETYNLAMRRVLRNRRQGLITATIPTSILTIKDVGKSFTLNPDSIVSGLYPSISSKVVLTDINTDNHSGYSDCTFFVRGENAV
jgi:hypothetical protein